MSNIDNTLAARRASTVNAKTVADAVLLAAIAEARVAMQAYRNKDKRS
jgi:hypothetical protein